MDIENWRPETGARNWPVARKIPKITRRRLRDVSLTLGNVARISANRPVKANGAARKARERDKRATETRLRGWACKTRTQKRRRKLSF
jgi:hypothetical protein